MLYNKVEICGVNTSNLPLLSKKEKEELFVKIKEGDKENSAVNFRPEFNSSGIDFFGQR